MIPTQNDDDTSPSDVNEDETVDQDEDEQSDEKRDAEKRINELLAKNKILESKLSDLEVRVNTPPPPPPPVTQQPPSNPEVQKAVEYLKNLGFVQRQDVDQRVQVSEDRLALNNEHTRLEKVFSGEDGRPKYDRKKTEAFMRERGIYDPESAYKIMNEPELLDWTIKNIEKTRKPKTFTEKTGAASMPASWDDDKSITREKIADSMKSPSGREWYERNRFKILDMMAKGQL